MKALTLTQPWATLVALQEKRLETRSWRTDYRGLLAIHAAKGFPGWAKETCDEPAFAKALYGRSEPGKPLPTGVVLCIVELVACVPTTDLHKLSAIGLKVANNEAYFGDYSEGRFAWALRFLELLETPAPAKGSLGLWDWHPAAPLSAGGAA